MFGMYQDTIALFFNRQKSFSYIVMGIITALFLYFSWNIFISSAQAAGTIYHVDCNDGNDLASGTDPSTAWKTLANVNSSPSKYSNGDTVLFKRGCVWNEAKITNTTSGVTYGAYGVGDAPSLRGSKTYNDPSLWTSDGPNRWYISNITNDPVVFSHDGALGVRKKSNESIDNLVSQWDYWYDTVNQRLYVYSSQNPADIGAEPHVLEAAYWGRAFADITTNIPWNDVMVQDIDFRHYRGHKAIGFWGGVTGWKFERISISQVAHDAIVFHANNGNLSASVKDSSFTDWGILNEYQQSGCKWNTENGCEGYAIQAIASVGTDSNNMPVSMGSAEVEITNSTFTINHNLNNYEMYGVMSDQGGWVRTFTGNKLINNNGTWKNGGMLIWRPSGNATNITIEGNITDGMGDIGVGVQELEYYGAHPTVTIRYNYLKNSDQSDSLFDEALRIREFSEDTDVEASYNIIDGTKAGTSVHDGILVNNAHGVKIFNNTIYGTDEGIKIYGEPDKYEVTNPSKYIDIRNNIISNSRVNGIGITSNPSRLIRADHNLFFANNWGNYGMPAGCCSGDINSDPLFVDAPNGNFALSVSSPAIDSALDLGTTYQDGLSSDSNWPISIININQNVYGTGWDMGAFIHDDKIPPTITGTWPDANTTNLTYVPDQIFIGIYDPAPSSSINVLASTVMLDGNQLNGCTLTSNNPTDSTISCPAPGNMSAGQHAISGTIVDNAGNTSTVSGSFTAIDSAAPTITGTWPDANTTNLTYVPDQILIGIYDPAPSSSINVLASTVMLDGNQLNGCTLTSNNPTDSTISCPAPGNMSAGQHAISGTIVDTAGNWREFSGSFTAIDIATPTITGTWPNANTTNLTYVPDQLFVSYFDPAVTSGINVGVILDGVALSCDTVTYTNTAACLIPPGLGSGIHNFAGVVSDNANHASSFSGSFTIE